MAPADPSQPASHSSSVMLQHSQHGPEQRVASAQLHQADGSGESEPEQLHDALPQAPPAQHARAKQSPPPQQQAPPQLAGTDSDDDSWTPGQPADSSAGEEQQHGTPSAAPAGAGAPAAAAAGAAASEDCSEPAGGAPSDGGAAATDSGTDSDDGGSLGSDDALGGWGMADDWDEEDEGEAWDPSLPPPVFCTNCTARLFADPHAECSDCGHSGGQDEALLTPPPTAGTAVAAAAACAGSNVSGGAVAAAAATAAAADGAAAAAAAADGVAAAADGAAAAAAAAAADGAAAVAAAVPAAAGQPILIWDEGMLLHEEGKLVPHPERPDRLRAIVARLGSSGLAGRCQRVPGRLATKAELLAVHTPEHLHRLQLFSSGAIPPSAIPSDTYVNAHTLECAALAAGCAAEAALRVLRGEARCGAAIIRPPGHHAESNTAMGFCFFNNAAVAARAAQAAGAARVLILDWDVHHGNGTQHIFEDDPSVLYMSLHRYDRGTFYPGTGGADEVGVGPGAGFTVNVPWDAPSMGDGDYLAALQQVLLPIAREFDPQLVIISAGFDAAAGDPIGGCCLSPAAFGAMTTALLPLGPTVLLLEGGYNLLSTALSTEACLRALLGEPPAALAALGLGLPGLGPAGPGQPGAPGSPALVPRPTAWGWLAIQAARKAHARFWACLTGASPHGAAPGSGSPEQQQQLAAMMEWERHHRCSDGEGEELEGGYESSEGEQQRRRRQQPPPPARSGWGVDARASGDDGDWAWGVDAAGRAGRRSAVSGRRRPPHAGGSAGGSSASGRSSGGGGGWLPPAPSRKQQMLRAIHSRALKTFWRRRRQQQQQLQQAHAQHGQQQVQHQSMQL